MNIELDNLSRFDTEYALKQVIQCYQHALKTFVAVQIDAADEIDEIVQETFVVFWENYATKGREITNLKGLLYRIAHNLTVSYIRKARIHRLFMLKNHHDNKVKTPYDHCYQQERSNMAFNEFQTLSKRDQSILTLYYVEEFRIEEIMDIMAMTEDAVRSRLKRARGRLKEKFYRKWSVKS